MPLVLGYCMLNADQWPKDHVLPVDSQAEGNNFRVEQRTGASLSETQNKCITYNTSTLSIS